MTFSLVGKTNTALQVESLLLELRLVHSQRVWAENVGFNRITKAPQDVWCWLFISCLAWIVYHNNRLIPADPVKHWGHILFGKATTPVTVFDRLMVFEQCSAKTIQQPPPQIKVRGSCRYFNIQETVRQESSSAIGLGTIVLKPWVWQYGRHHVGFFGGKRWPCVDKRVELGSDWKPNDTP